MADKTPKAHLAAARQDNGNPGLTLTECKAVVGPELLASELDAVSCGRCYERIRYYRNTNMSRLGQLWASVESAELSLQFAEAQVAKAAERVAEARALALDYGSDGQRATGAA